MAAPAFDRLARGLRSIEANVERLLARRLAFALVLLALAGFSFWLRFSVVLESPSAGPDYGHYLIAANWYAGNDRSGEGPFDLPVVPLLVLGLSPLTGRVGALQVLGPAAAAAMLPAAAFLLERWVPRWAACATATSFVLWQPFTEFIAFGGPTNLLGIAVSLVFYRVLFETLDKPTAGWRPRRVDWTASLLLVLLISTHHFTALMTGLTALAWVALRLALVKASRPLAFWTSLRIAGAAALLSLPYVPYLLSLVATDAAYALGRPFPAEATFDLTNFVWRRHWEIWTAFLLLSLLAFRRLRRTSAILPAFAAFLCVPPVLLLTVLASHPTRVLYFAQFPLILGVALWTTPGAPPHLPRPLPGRVLAVARTLAATLLLLSVPLLAADVQADQRAAVTHYHQALPAATFDAFEWIAANTPADSTIAVDAGPAAQYNQLWKSMATGWWLEGYANRRAIYEANLPLLPFQPKWDDARDANRLFAGEAVFEDGILRVADSFPYDDASGPAILTGYYLDYREFLTFRVPRLYDARNDHFSLITGASPEADLAWDRSGARVSGNMSGPGFTAVREMVFDSPSHRVRLNLSIDLSATAPWTEFELTLRVPPWVQADFTGFSQGTVDLGVPDASGFLFERARLNLVTANLSGGRLTAPVAFKVEADGVGIRWNLSDRHASLSAELVLTRLPTTGPPTHDVEYHGAREILTSHGVTYLFVAYDSPSNAQRFERQPSRYEKVFHNTAATVFSVR